jgi:hypothetical protein
MNELCVDFETLNSYMHRNATIRYGHPPDDAELRDYLREFRYSLDTVYCDNLCEFKSKCEIWLGEYLKSQNLDRDS